MRTHSNISIIARLARIIKWPIRNMHLPNWSLDKNVADLPPQPHKPKRRDHIADTAARRVGDGGGHSHRPRRSSTMALIITEDHGDTTMLMMWPSSQDSGGSSSVDSGGCGE